MLYFWLFTTTKKAPIWSLFLDVVIFFSIEKR